jgi:hypothetical protein
MSRVRTAGVRRLLLLLLVLALVVGCAGDGRLPRIRLPRRGPVDVFIDIIDQVSRLGEGISRQIRRMTRTSR